MLGQGTGEGLADQLMSDRLKRMRRAVLRNQLMPEADRLLSIRAPY